MSDKETNRATANERGLVVKNKKYNKTDLIAFGVCLLAAIVIWTHATNLRYKEEQNRNEPPLPPSDMQTEVEN
ncbi:MAG: hypothetical protein IIV11_00845 [Clostridia bacterium]|jgi:hypothetical protein|nr:hypothetical protein [Clostridia bacterium]